MAASLVLRPFFAKPDEDRNGYRNGRRRGEARACVASELRLYLGLEGVVVIGNCRNRLQRGLLR